MPLKNLNTVFWILIFIILGLQLYSSEEFSLALSLLYSLVVTGTCYLYAWGIRIYVIRARLNQSGATAIFMFTMFFLTLLCAVVLTLEDYLIESLNHNRRILPLLTTDLLPTLFSTWMASILITGVGYAFELDRHHIGALKKQQSLQNELMEMELRAIRYQLSPHFTFNILNNLQFLIQKDTTEALRLLSRYSKILRYYIYESRNHTILVNDEITFIKNYIEIERQRLGPGLYLETRWKVPAESPARIAPFILSAFVENAFKHLSSANKRARLECFLDQDKLYFRLKNSYDRRPEEPDKGVGMEQAVKRLELIYPDRYQLRIRDHDDIFDVDLHIRL